MTNTKIFGVLADGRKVEIPAAGRMVDKQGLAAALALCERLNTQKRGGYFGEFVNFESEAK